MGDLCDRAGHGRRSRDHHAGLFDHQPRPLRRICLEIPHFLHPASEHGRRLSCPLCLCQKGHGPPLCASECGQSLLRALLFCLVSGDHPLGRAEIQCYRSRRFHDLFSDGPAELFPVPGRLRGDRYRGRHCDALCHRDDLRGAGPDDQPDHFLPVPARARHQLSASENAAGRAHRAGGRERGHRRSDRLSQPASVRGRAEKAAFGAHAGGSGLHRHRHERSEGRQRHLRPRRRRRSDRRRRALH